MQKGFILFALCLFMGLNLQAQQLAVLTSSETKEAISWDQKLVNLGDIPQNIPAPAEFVLTNNSDQPIIITNVKGSCGCTATKHDDSPILPGKSTTITATYNAKKTGPFIKSVTVTTSHGEPQVVKLKGNVLKPDLPK